jgi:hypothetical protein
MMPPMTAAVVEAKPSSRRKPGAEIVTVLVWLSMSEDFCRGPDNASATVITATRMAIR